MRYLFNPYRFDTATRELTRDGEVVHLSPKAFELLRLLIEGRPNVVSKATLMERIWPDTFVVDANLPILMGEVRAALGESGRGATIVRTHSGVGYSFTAPVREVRRLDHVSSYASLLVGERDIQLALGPNVVGRDEAADVRLNDRSVSREHARIIVEADCVRIEDLNSKNGTKVRGVPIAGAVDVGDGDEVVFGSIPAKLSLHSSQSTSTLTL